MTSRNHTNHIGRVGKDPELKYTPKGTAMATFSIAIDTGEGNDAMWIPITVYGKNAETANEILHAGDLVGIDGRLNVYNYEKDGQKRTGFNIIANTWDILAKKGGSSGGGNGSYKKKQEEAAEADESAFPF